MQRSSIKWFLLMISATILIWIQCQQKGLYDSSKSPKKLLRLNVMSTGSIDSALQRHHIRIMYDYMGQQRVKTPCCKDCLVSDFVDVRFNLGRPNSIDKSRLEYENEIFKDLVFLDIHENMNDGKTFELFKATWESPLLYDFIAKADDDSYQWSISKQVYLGRFWYPENQEPFMQGALYILSRALVHSIMTTPTLLKVGHEDWVTGTWTRDLPVTEINFETHFADAWREIGPIEFYEDSLLFHRCKTIEKHLEALHSYFPLDDLTTNNRSISNPKIEVRTHVLDPDFDFDGMDVRIVETFDRF